MTTDCWPVPILASIQFAELSSFLRGDLDYEFSDEKETETVARAYMSKHHCRITAAHQQADSLSQHLQLCCALCRGIRPVLLLQ